MDCCVPKAGYSEAFDCHSQLEANEGYCGSLTPAQYDWLEFFFTHGTKGIQEKDQKKSERKVEEGKAIEGSRNMDVPEGSNPLSNDS